MSRPAQSVTCSASSPAGASFARTRHNKCAVAAGDEPIRDETQILAAGREGGDPGVSPDSVTAHGGTLIDE